MSRKIILYELNEVPLRIIDEFCKWRPESALARRLSRCSQYETWSHDEVPLSPWITWPTLHRGVTYHSHQIAAFGQDLTAVDQQYPPVWHLLCEQGVSTGVFGSLHTYPPPKDVDRYAFYMPDTFAYGPESHPKPLTAFQDFNLSMARENARNVSTSIPLKRGLEVLARAPQLGLRPSTFVDLAGQLVSERLNSWRRIRRRTYQTVLGFDVFMKQLRDTRPQFCTFFSNHVASSMHRYWPARFPEDYDEFAFDQEWVERFSDEIEWSMGKFDDEFERLTGFVDTNPDYVLMVTSSMGQAATETHVHRTQLYLRHLDRFMSRLGFAGDEWERRPAMDPDVNVVVVPAKADAFRTALENLLVNEKALKFREKENGFFNMVIGGKNVEDRPRFAVWNGEKIPYDELGLVVEEVEDQTGPSAYHVPEGTLLIYDPALAAPRSDRPRVSTVEVAPFLLSTFGAPVPDYMTADVHITPL